MAIPQIGQLLRKNEPETPETPQKAPATMTGPRNDSEAGVFTPAGITVDGDDARAVVFLNDFQ